MINSQDYQPEIRAMLQDMAPLSTTGRVNLYSMPVRPRAETTLVDEEMARIMGNVACDVRWGSLPDDLEVAIQCCLRTNAKLCVRVSPSVPDLVSPCLCDEEKKYVEQWQRFTDVVNNRVEIAAVLNGFEGGRKSGKPFYYDHIHPTTVASRNHNRLVSDYHRIMRDVTERFVPGMGVNKPKRALDARRSVADIVDYLQWGHMTMIPDADEEHGGWAVSPHTSPMDGLDYFDLPWYSPLQPRAQDERLRRTVEIAERFGILKGTLRLCPGLSQPLGGDGAVCPYPEWNYGYHLHPYDPRISFTTGQQFSRMDWWYNRVMYGLAGRNDRFPPYIRIKNIVLWPGIFREGTDLINGPHLVALLSGLAGTPNRFYPRRLTEMQNEQWEAWCNRSEPEEGT